MNQERIISLKQLVPDGHLFHNTALDRIEAYIPTRFPTNHAAYLLELQSGDLLCVWFAGSDEGASDIRIVMSQLAQDSAQWSQPATLSNASDKSEQNPSLFQAPSGDLWLMHTAMDTRGCTLEEWQQKLAAHEVTGSFAMQHTSQILRKISTDQGQTWGASHVLFAEPGSFCRQPVQVLSNGTWIVGNWRSMDQHGAFGSDVTWFQLSQDQGRTWNAVEVPGSAGRVHANVIELEGGRLAAFFRSRAADRIYISRSDDFGFSWSVPERTSLPNNNASISAIKLQSGRIAVIYNDISLNDDPSVTLWPYERYPVTVALSEDEGRTWPYKRYVDIGDGYAGDANKASNRRYEYPCIIQAKDGLIHTVYSYGTRECIKHVSFTEGWIIGGGASRWPWRNFPVT